MRHLAVVIALLLMAAAIVAAPPTARPLEIFFVDVEGGAATLIVTPAGESLLVDSGWPRDDDRDARRIYSAAQQTGLKRIDYLVTTHFHRDHFGGLGGLSKLIPIGKFLDHGRLSELAEDREWFPKLNQAYLRAAKGDTQTLRPGDAISLKPATGAAPLNLRVVVANAEVMKRGGPENPQCRNAKLQTDDPSDNARSVGLLLSFGKFRFLDLGDLTWNIEQKLVCPSNLIGTVELYQVTHHGANGSNNPVLLRSVQPRVAVMNNGPRKGGHPDTVKWLRALPSLQALYQLHRNVGSRDEENAAPEFIANLGPEEGCPAHLLKVSVAADSQSYTVTNGRTGQERRYAVKN